MLLNLGSKSFQPTTILFVWIIIPQSLGESCIEELNEFTVPFTDVGRLALVDRYVDGSGQVRIKGNGNLKGSQSYPVQFLYSNLLFSICLDHLALCIRSSRNRTLPDLHQKNVILFAPGHQTMGIYTASFPSSSPSKVWKVIIKIEDPTHEPFAHPCSWPHQTKHQELSHIP